MTTLVKFRIHEKNNDLFAYFPKLKFNYLGQLACYSHIGQHSGCGIDYVKECRPAKPEEYNDLKKELESLGYTLKICK